MAVATKPTTATAKRLLAAYRAEEEHWTPHELLDGLLELPHMLPATVARFTTRLVRPRCSAMVASKMAAAAIAEMVDRGRAAEVEAFLKCQACARAGSTRAQRIAAIIATASRVDAEFPRTRLDRQGGDLSSTELLLAAAVDAADERELGAMLEAVLGVASDRVVDAVYGGDTRKSEERMLAEYLADRARGAA